MWLLLFLQTCLSDQSVSLAGKWRFALDRTDAGIGERWFERSLAGTVELPGSLPAQGIGDEVTLDTTWIGGIVDRSFFTAPQFAKYREPGHVKVPFWLQPDKYYAGVAWYQRDCTIPAGWEGKRVVLFLERAHCETRTWVDARFIGSNNSLSTPHEYDLGQLAPGKHTLSVRVDNRMAIDLGENSHCISDHTQGDWNGIVGDISLRATAPLWIADAQVFPNLARQSAHVTVAIGNRTGARVSAELRLSPVVFLNVTSAPALMQRVIQVEIPPGGSTVQADLLLQDACYLWDEFNPHLYSLGLRVAEADNRTVFDQRNVTFGLRDFAAQGTQFTVNGRKTFIRGTLECCIFPRTGHPPMEVGEWKRILAAARAHGLNLLRFHSYCPPEAAFAAADELGFYLQVETCWANQSTTLGDGKPVDQWVYDETDRILKTYGNHPSFVLMPYGNEPGGGKVEAYLSKYVAHFKAQDPRRLWTSGSGWPQLPENQFHVTPDPRIQAWGGGLKSRINAKPPETTTDYRDYIAARTVPVVSHEIGQWCVYPNFDEIPKYTGYLKPKNFEIFRDFLAQNGLMGLARQFLLASGKLQTLCYKEEIESALRTPGMGGFELLDLHDFPGQGTALVGVLDPFWDDKGYVTAKEYRRFCNCTVPLARLSKRVFTSNESLRADLEVAHFGSAPLTNAVVTWALRDATGKALTNGGWPVKLLPLGNAIPLGSLNLNLSFVQAPGAYKLFVGVGEASFASPPRRNEPPVFENDWDLWVYPPSAANTPPADVLITAQFNDEARARLRAGGKVLLSIPGRQVRNFEAAPVILGFSSIFWNTAWTHRQAPTSLGILCDPKHPALAGFPTEFHSNWQWWYLIHRAGALRLDLLPRGVQPIVRVIDDWFTARPLALVVEGKVGAGRIVVCGFDLTQEVADPVSRQMRSSLIDYMASKEFNPAADLTTEQIQSLVVEAKDARLRGVRAVKADSAQIGYEPENATDGDPDTIWHTGWDGNPPGFPHELVIEFDAPRKITGFTALPRQDGNHNGWIKNYSCYASTDGQTWGKPVAQGTFTQDASLKTVKFPAPITAGAIKLVALSGFADGPWASLAEFNVISAEPAAE